MVSTISSLALMASIVASVMGALIVCVLVFRYGFTIPAARDSEAGPSPTDVMITRAGHAVAGACFTATAVLAVVALSLGAPGRPPVVTSAPVSPARVAVAPAVTPDPGRSDVDLASLRQRLAQAEEELARLDDEMRNPPPRVAAPRRSTARARVETRPAARPSAIATAPSGHADGLFAAPRRAWQFSRDRAASLAGDVRTAFMRVERAVARHVGADGGEPRSAHD